MHQSSHLHHRFQMTIAKCRIQWNYHFIYELLKIEKKKKTSPFLSLSCCWVVDFDVIIIIIIMFSFIPIMFVLKCWAHNFYQNQINIHFLRICANAAFANVVCNLKYCVCVNTFYNVRRCHTLPSQAPTKAKEYRNFKPKEIKNSRQAQHVLITLKKINFATNYVEFDKSRRCLN